MSGFFLNQPKDYFVSIEDAMTTALGRPYRTTPLEWSMLSEWEAKIPLHIVLRAISECFDGKKDIRSLNYCKTAVERLWNEYQAGMVGQSQELDIPITCLECNDLRQIWIKPIDAEYDWVRTPVECPSCL